MRKSIWIEAIEWCLLVVMALFLFGVLALRAEITSSADEHAGAPIASYED
jgi:hypothetical protein